MPDSSVLSRTPILSPTDRLIGHRLRVVSPDLAGLLSSLAADPTQASLFVDVAAGNLDALSGVALEAGCLVLHPMGEAGDHAASAQHLSALHRRGVRIALLDANPRSPWLDRLSSAEFAGVAIGAVPPDHLKRYVAALHRRGVRVMATGVRSLAQRHDAQTAGVDLIEGDWLLHDPQIGSARVEAIYGSVMRALSLARAEAPFTEIEQALRSDPTLAFRLMRYVNSAAFGLRTQVGSLREALPLIGYRPLARWLGLSLVTASIDTGANAALAALATLRGRLMELLCPRLAPTEDPNEAFFTGLLSVLPAMLSTTTEQVLAAVQPAAPVAAALLAGSGSLGELLTLAQHCESPEPDAQMALCERLGLASGAVAQAQIEALPWAERTAAAQTAG